ncbi:hypothetical protein H6F77_08360 [Microcoleus sp. FACHB-831]|uniref:hypothetical protein n=1 Tax=Microcoleus sp. FACHB-831 TaxID=2692827 RepID=UPI001684A0FA|nr:hypothetical protein [Microcoleus sp. FACHB-831]MBD1921102.1 hypothetical protein [Microcoleus sp. FACHB-831]
MNQVYPERRRLMRIMALVLSALLSVPFLTACGGGEQSSAPPPVDAPAANTRRASNPPPARQPQAKKGLSTGQKVAITLAGAAALYYLYNQHKNKQGQGAQGKYYLSKNGRVYYRDAQGKAIWVTPPKEGIQVPPEEAERYRDFQGYNNRSTGKDLTELGSDAVPAQTAP